MAGTSVKITLRPVQARLLLERVTNATAYRGAVSAKRKAQGNIRAKGRVRTGALHDSIAVKKVNGMRPDRSAYRVGSPLHYAGHQEHGVRPFSARPGGVLVFQPKGVNAFVFSATSSGFEGAHFMRDAVKSLTVADFTRGVV